MEAEKSKIAIIPEEELAEKLEREVEPYLESICRKGRCGEKDALYYELFLLPEAKGRTYTECDIDTDGCGSRGARRLIFSSDGLYFYTTDHYETFREVTVTDDYEVNW